jgi:hypothetical protein
MQHIACVGSGPASIVFALAVKRIAKSTAATIFRQGVDNEPNPSFALSNNQRRNIRGRLESVLETLQPLHRWQRMDVIHRGATTTVDTELGGALERTRLMITLEQAVLDQNCNVHHINSADFDRELASFDFVALDEADVALDRTHFEYDIAHRRAHSICFAVTQLATDRVLEVVQRGSSLFFGHGFSVGDGQASFFVEANAEAWLREGLLDAKPDVISAYMSDAFSRSLHGGRICSSGQLSQIYTAIRVGGVRKTVSCLEAQPKPRIHRFYTARNSRWMTPLISPQRSPRAASNHWNATKGPGALLRQVPRVHPTSKWTGWEICTAMSIFRRRPLPSTL